MATFCGRGHSLQLVGTIRCDKNCGAALDLTEAAGPRRDSEPMAHGTDRSVYPQVPAHESRDAEDVFRVEPAWGRDDRTT